MELGMMCTDERTSRSSLRCMDHNGGKGTIMTLGPQETDVVRNHEGVKLQSPIHMVQVRNPHPKNARIQEEEQTESFTIRKMKKK